MLTYATVLPKGLVNRNPGNIRFNPANDWKGGIGQDVDGFVVFSESKYGVRAASKLLDSYYNRHHLHSVRDIITRWAPPSENDTESYIKNVAKSVGVHPDEKLAFTVFQVIKPNMLNAIFKHENGSHDFSQKDIIEWSRLA